MKSWLAKFALVAALLWALTACLFGVLVIGSGADLESIQARQEIAALLKDSPALAHFEGDWRLLNRLALWLLVTGALLATVCVSALLRRQESGGAPPVNKG